MKLNRFLVLFTFTIVISCGAMYLCSRSADIGPYADIGLYATVVYSFLSIIVFVLTAKVEGTKRKIILVQLIMGNMIFKVLLSALIVAVYYKLKAPDDGIFILPFLIIYVIWTLFETFFMNEQARSR